MEGAGKDSLPDNANFQVIYTMLPVHDVDAFKMCRRPSETEGLVCVWGGSIGQDPPPHTPGSIRDARPAGGRIMKDLASPSVPE